MAKNEMVPYCPFTFVDEKEKMLNDFQVKATLTYYRMQKMHMSQKDIAAMIGVSPSTVSRVETFKETSFGNILKYAHACGLQVQLVPKEPYDPNQPKIIDFQEIDEF